MHSGIKIVDSFQSISLRPDSYLNKIKKSKQQFKGISMHRIGNLNDLVALQIEGKSQLDKEVEET